MQRVPVSSRVQGYDSTSTKVEAKSNGNTYSPSNAPATHSSQSTATPSVSCSHDTKTTAAYLLECHEHLERLRNAQSAPFMEKYPLAWLGDTAPAAPHSVVHAPEMVPRRLKFCRKALFHNKSMKNFKLDIFVLVGVNEVEMFHFYNPGEATVVFRSSDSAQTVFDWMEAAAMDADHPYYKVHCILCRDLEDRELTTAFEKGGNVRRSSNTKPAGGAFYGPLIFGR